MRLSVRRRVQCRGRIDGMEGRWRSEVSAVPSVYACLRVGFGQRGENWGTAIVSAIDLPPM